ncbi:MAG TPA: carbohydrate binding family 9 domain-containing protein, partial [Vicinamibacteria bacterium]
MIPSLLRRLALVVGLFAPGLSPPTWGADPLPVVPPIVLPRASLAVTLDGDLSEPAWREAAPITRFWDITFGDNRAPLVETRAFVMYDAKALYVGVVCDDPEPAKIRAPFVERDNVFATQDNVAVFVDTRNDRRAASEFRVNARGIQGDAVYNDATQDEDFTPDFYYGTAARITDRGWQFEMRIPFSTLRYPRTDPQSWGIRIWRNYPRTFRHGIFSSPYPAGSNCFVCHLHELSGITGLPSSGHLVAAPYVSGQDVAEAPAPGDPLGEGDQE